MKRQNILQDGRQWELEVFGFTSLKVPPSLKNNPLIEIARVMNQQDRYDWDPAAPKTQVAQELFLAVQARLEKKGYDFRALKFYCCLGSGLDSIGVDGFFELEGSIATLDLTTRQEKVNNRHYHSIFYRHRTYPEAIAKLGRGIAHILIKRRIELYAAH